MRFFRQMTAVMAVAAVLAAMPATAQVSSPADGADETSPATGGDIVVTAQKSGAQSLQEVPLAIQAFGGEELKERNIGNIDDLVSVVPGAFEGQRQSVASRSYNLRGAGGSNANGDSPIGYYLDDVPFIVTNFGIAPPVRFLDIERVEVLRGPQGTLYGQGSSGGVFIFHTRDPDLNDIEVVAEATLGSTKGADALNYGVSGAISVPIIDDKLAVRLSGGHSRNPGWADEYYGAFDGTPDETGVNKVKNDDFRAVVLFRPVDNFRLRAQYWQFRPRQDFLGFMESVDPPYYANTAAQDSFGNGKFELYSLTGELDLDTVSITSSTSYLEGNFGILVPISPVGSFSSQFYPDMFAQEVRVNSTTSGPLHWVIGGQYQDGQGPQANALTLNVPIFSGDNNTITKNWAVFGEVSYDLLDGKLVPLLGLRQYHDKRTFEDGLTSSTDTQNVTTWRANLSYIPTPDLTMFVTASTGFRAGIVQSQAQVDALLADGIPVSTQLRPERSRNYEVGVKWRTMDNAISIGVNGYITKFTDLQTSTPSSVPNLDGFSNFGNATTKGIDFELRWRTPLDGLVLSAVGNVNDGEFTKVDPAVQAALPDFAVGSRIVNTIQNNYRFDANYTTEVGKDLELFSNASFSRSGNRLQSNGLIANPYELVNATLGLRRGPYEMALVGDNLLDERGPTLLGNTGPLSGSGPTPRTVTLRLRVNFQ